MPPSSRPLAIGATVSQSDRIRQIAELAQLSLAEDDLESLTQDFLQITLLFEQISRLSLDEMPAKETLAPHLRDDRVMSTEVAMLLECAPTVTDNLFITPTAIKS